MPIWHAVVLGVIQGLTEFLPISSTAHLVIARQWLGHEKADDAFTTVIQLGTLVAVFAYFRRDIRELALALVADFRTGRFAGTPQSRLAWLIGLGTLPVVVVGLRFKRQIKEKFYDVPTMAVVAIVFALSMAAAEVWVSLRRPTLPGRPSTYTETPERITIVQAVAVGLWQVLALMPGASRSGTTITGGLFAGLTRPAAARYSFLLSLPSVLGAGCKELYDEYKEFARGEPSLFTSGDQLVPLAVGLVVSGVVGYAAIAWLLRFLTRFSLYSFVAYRVALGAVLLGLVAGGWVAPKPGAKISGESPPTSIGGSSG